MTNAGLPQQLALRSRRRVLEDAAQGLGSARGAHLSIRGGRFRLIDAKGVEQLLQTHYLDMVIIDANSNAARVYFEGEYVPDSDDPPVCWSDNGTGPSTQSMMPQAPSCVQCPHNMRGTKQTFSGKATTACENRKKVAFIVPDDPAINVYEFQIPPGSLSNFRDYCKWLGTQSSGVEGRSMDTADVVTRVEFDPDKQFTMLFSAAAFADDDRTIQLIQYIDENQLSDVAVGRNDVACDPQQVAAMITNQNNQRSLPAGAPPAEQRQQPQDQRFALPPRANGASHPNQPNLEAGNGQQRAAPPPPPAAAPKKRNTRQQAALAPAGEAPQQTQQEVIPPNRTTPADGSIPSFLRRDADNNPPGGQQQQAPTPTFGVNRAPPPPSEISDALSKAMALPTRRG
jgi:hypothetical protein